MPIMDGFQATQEIRRLVPKQSIYIVALTAYATETFEQKCYQSGMDLFLTKPVNDEKIAKIMK